MNGHFALPAVYLTLAALLSLGPTTLAQAQVGAADRVWLEENHPEIVAEIESFMVDDLVAEAQIQAAAMIIRLYESDQLADLFASFAGLDKDGAIALLTEPSGPLTGIGADIVHGAVEGWVVDHMAAWWTDVMFDAPILRDTHPAFKTHLERGFEAGLKEVWSISTHKGPPQALVLVKILERAQDAIEIYKATGALARAEHAALIATSLNVASAAEISVELGGESGQRIVRWTKESLVETMPDAVGDDDADTVQAIFEDALDALIAHHSGDAATARMSYEHVITSAEQSNLNPLNLFDLGVAAFSEGKDAPERALAALLTTTEMKTISDAARFARMFNAMQRPPDGAPQPLLRSSLGDAQTFGAYRARFTSEDVGRIVGAAHTINWVGDLRVDPDFPTPAAALAWTEDLLKAFADELGLTMQELRLFSDGRNIHQHGPRTEIPSHADILDQPDWRRAPPSKSALHAFGYPLITIHKMVHDRGCEFIFHHRNGIMVPVNDGVNTGTFNYASDDWAHVVLDVAPWILWGIGAEETGDAEWRAGMALKNLIAKWGREQTIDRGAALRRASENPGPAPSNRPIDCPGVAAYAADPGTDLPLSWPLDEPATADPENAGAGDPNAVFMQALSIYLAAPGLPEVERDEAYARVADIFASVLREHSDTALAAGIRNRSVPGVDFALLDAAVGVGTQEPSTAPLPIVAPSRNYAAPDGYSWVQLASRRTIEEARAFAAEIGDGARIFRTRNGWYAVTGALLYEGEDWAGLVADEGWPPDSLLSQGEGFVEELSIEPRGPAPEPAFVRTRTLRPTEAVLFAWEDDHPYISDRSPLAAGVEVATWGRWDILLDYCEIAGGEGAALPCADLAAFSDDTTPPEVAPGTPVQVDAAPGEWGPGIVASPGVDYASCGGRADVSECLKEQGLSNEAVRFSMTNFGDSSGRVFATDFKELGFFDLAHVEMAGGNRVFKWPVLLNGNEGFDTFSLAEDLDEFTDQASRRALSQVPIPELRTRAISGHRMLPSGSQRFVEVRGLTDFCQACPVVGQALSFHDIDPDGRKNVTRIGIAVGDFAGKASITSRDLKDHPVALQYRLNMLGYDAGPMDGFAGPQTRQALMEFQAEHCLAPTGQPDAATVHALAQADGFATPCAGARLPAGVSANAPLLAGVYVTDSQICSSPAVTSDIFESLRYITDNGSERLDTNCRTGRTDIFDGFTRFRGTCNAEGETQQMDVVWNIEANDRFTVAGSGRQDTWVRCNNSSPLSVYHGFDQPSTVTQSSEANGLQGCTPSGDPRFPQRMMPEEDSSLHSGRTTSGNSWTLQLFSPGRDFGDAQFTNSAGTTADGFWRRTENGICQSYNGRESWSCFEILACEGETDRFAMRNSAGKVTSILEASIGRSYESGSSNDTASPISSLDSTFPASTRVRGIYDGGGGG